MPYRLYVPPDYDPDYRYPLVLFLHGWGERGTDNVSQINGNIDNLFAHVKMEAYKSLLLAPQASSAGWNEAQVQLAVEIVQQVQESYDLDVDRAFVTGLSNGGSGTWGSLSHHQNVFAAGVPVCPGSAVFAAPLLVGRNIWAFHAADDPSLPVEGTRATVQAIRDLGGVCLYTEYPTGGHAIWGRAYNTTELYDWMYAQVRPSLTCESNDLGDGLRAWTFRIANSDSLLLPYSVELGFEGVGGATIHQVAFNGAMPVNSETLADAADGMGSPPYNKARDSWAFAPFGDNTVPGTNPLTGLPLTGFYEAANAFAFSCFSGGGSQLGDDVPVAYVVADGNVQWTGKLVRYGVDYPTTGVTGAESALPGDFNDDGTVSGADYVIWADTFGNDGSPGKEDLRADANGDGTVSGADYVVWADNFGAGGS